MEVEFYDTTLDRLETDKSFRPKLSGQVIKAFRKRMQLIRSAPDERVFYSLRSLNFEKPKGDRAHQYSMRLNDQWRLIVELNKTSNPTVVVIKGIEDYH